MALGQGDLSRNRPSGLRREHCRARKGGFFLPGELTSGQAYVRVTNGPNIFEVDLATGAITPRRESRNFVDMCDALA